VGIFLCLGMFLGKWFGAASTNGESTWNLGLLILLLMTIWGEYAHFPAPINHAIDHVINWVINYVFGK